MDDLDLGNYINTMKVIGRGYHFFFFFFFFFLFFFFFFFFFFSVVFTTLANNGQNALVSFASVSLLFLRLAVSSLLLNF